MRVVKDRDIQKLGLSNKVKRQYKDREIIKNNVLFSFFNIYDCYKYIKDNIPGFADLFYSEKYDFNISRSIKIIQIVCRANANISVGIVQDPCEENDRLYICSGNNERQMFNYMSKHCPESVIEIENTGMMSAAKYYYGNTDDDCHSMSSTLLDVTISYLKKVSSRKYPEYLRVPESRFSGVLESAKKETKLIKETCNQKVNALEWLNALKESSALGLSKNIKKKFDKVDAVDNVFEIQFEDPEVERICHDHDVYTIGDAIKVSSIKEWFSNNDKIKSFNELKYFKSLSVIEDYAFSFCSSLQTVTIPNSVVSIGYRAFEQCKSLQSVIIPNSVTSIGPASFFVCGSLQSVIIPNSVTSIKEGTFWGCGTLQSVTIPNSVTSIERSVFSLCKALQTVVIPNRVTGIEKYTFYKCESLQSVTIPNMVTIIGDNAFLECKSLKTIVIPDSVISIGDNAFSNCDDLKKVYMSSSCKAFDRIMSEIRKNSKDTIIIDPNTQKLLKKAELVESVVRENKEPNITNSQGQDVPELGKHAENVYLPDCPFMIGKDQVDWFEYFQREKEKHTIKDVDDFVQSAKKETKLIEESCNQKVNALEWFVALKESSALGLSKKVNKTYNLTHDKNITLKQLCDLVRAKIYTAVGYPPDKNVKEVPAMLRLYDYGSSLIVADMRVDKEYEFNCAKERFNERIEIEQRRLDGYMADLAKKTKRKEATDLLLECISNTKAYIAGLIAGRDIIESLGWYVFMNAMQNTEAEIARAKESKKGQSL